MQPTAPTYDVTVRINKLKSPTSSEDTARYRLRRVPEWVRAVNPNAYTPQYICIGPYHRGEPGNHLRREELKIRSVQRLLQAEDVRKDLGIKEEADIGGCFDVLKQQVANTRSIYAEGFDMDDDDWAMMLLLDGCFIIMHLFDYAFFLRSDHTRPVAAQIKIDLVLLENQLPFSVLESIFDFLFHVDRFPRMLRALALFYWAGVTSQDLQKVYTEGEKVHHLVHLIHLAHCDMIDAAQELQRWQYSKSWAWALSSKIFKNAISFCPIMFMMVLRCCKNEVKHDPAAKREEAAAAAVDSAKAAAEAVKKAVEKAHKADANAAKETAGWTAAEDAAAAAKEAAEATSKLLAAIKRVPCIAHIEAKEVEEERNKAPTAAAVEASVDAAAAVIKMECAWKPVMDAAEKAVNSSWRGLPAAVLQAAPEAAKAAKMMAAAARKVKKAAKMAAAAADKTKKGAMKFKAKESENIASAMELHNLGLRFVKGVGGSEYHVRISGNDEDTLVIPQVEVSCKMAPLLHNLIALEQQRATDELKIVDHFSKYVFLMYNLINSHEDIALLQGRGILLNNYGTDEQVVSYFKNLLLWNSRDPWKSPAGQTPIEKVCDFFANLCPWKDRRYPEQDARMAVEKALDVLKDRTTHRAYRDWAEARKYWNSPVQVVLLIIAGLTFASTVVSLVVTLRSG